MALHSPAEQRSISPILILAGLAAAVGLSYGGSLWNGFTFDDQAVIVRNSLIKRVEHWPTLLTSDYWAGARDPAVAPTVRLGLYRPLVVLSYAFNYAVAGLSPFPYHLINVLFHLLVTWLLYVLARQLTFSYRAALVSALLFALHPIHVEAVAGVVGRAELLMAAGVFASLWWGIRGRRALSLTAFLVALLSKEQAVVLPFLMLLYDVSFNPQTQAVQAQHTRLRRSLVRYGPYVALLFGYGLVRGMILGLSPPPTPFLDNPLPHLDWWPRLLTTIKVAGQYLLLFIWPGQLSADYSYNAIPASHSLLDGGVLFGLLAWGGLLTVTVVSYRRAPRIFFAVGILFVTFVPVSNAILPIGTIMGERLFYLPSAGLCLLCGAAFDAFVGWTYVGSAAGDARPAARGHLLHLIRATGLGLLIALCLVLLLRTMLRTKDWADDEHLARSAVEVVPNSAKVHSILGRLAKDNRQWDTAIEQFQSALQIYPEYRSVDPTLNSNFGIALIESGHTAEGVEAFERAVALEPRWSLPRYNLGFAYAKQGRHREAEAAYHDAARLNDEDPKPYTGLAFLYLKELRYDDALSAAEAALKRDPSYAEAQFVKDQALRALGGPRSTSCPPGIIRC